MLKSISDIWSTSFSFNLGSSMFDCLILSQICDACLWTIDSHRFLLGTTSIHRNPERLVLIGDVSYVLCNSLCRTNSLSLQTVSTPNSSSILIFLARVTAHVKCCKLLFLPRLRFSTARWQKKTKTTIFLHVVGKRHIKISHQLNRCERFFSAWHTVCTTLLVVRTIVFVRWETAERLFIVRAKQWCPWCGWEEWRWDVVEKWRASPPSPSFHIPQRKRGSIGTLWMCACVYSGHVLSVQHVYDFNGVRSTGRSTCSFT